MVNMVSGFAASIAGKFHFPDSWAKYVSGFAASLAGKFHLPDLLAYCIGGTAACVIATADRKNTVFPHGHGRQSRLKSLFQHK